MPVFVISLHRDAALEAQLLRLCGERPTFVGVDGKAMPAARYFELNIGQLRRRKRPLSPGETGCALAHLAAWQQLLDGAAASALIFEHDVIVPPSLAHLDTAVFEDRFDVVLLGCMQGMKGERLLRGKRVAALPGIDMPLYAVPPRFSRYLLRSAAYWISREAAQGLRDSQMAALCKADDWRIWARGLGLRMGFIDLCAHPLDLTYSLLERERRALCRHRAPAPRVPRQKWYKWLYERVLERCYGLEPCCRAATGRASPASARGDQVLPSGRCA